MKRSLALFMAIATAGLVASSGSARPERSGALHVTKECSEYHGQVGEFCTITSSNITAIKRGMRVVYLQAPGSDGVLDSDIVLSRGHGVAAIGHVLVGETGGTVTLSGGTGPFKRFRADADVSVDASGLWHWDGTYSFIGPGDDD